MLFGAAETQGDEAYQVWLIKDGQRSSAGTFRVSDTSRGIGLLAMPIQGGKLDFDAIGITLEPDEHGSQPRGDSGGRGCVHFHRVGKHLDRARGAALGPGGEPEDHGSTRNDQETLRAKALLVAPAVISQHRRSRNPA